MRQRPPHGVAPILKLFEKLRDRRVIDRIATAVGNKVPLTYIGHVARLLILGEEMVEWLIARWAQIFGNRLIPFLTICKDRVDIENDTAKVEEPVADDFTYAKAAASLTRGVNGPSRLAGKKLSTFHDVNMELLRCKTSLQMRTAPRYARILEEARVQQGLASA